MTKPDSAIDVRMRVGYNLGMATTTSNTSNTETTMSRYGRMNGKAVFISSTDTTHASTCCGYAVRTFANGADVCEFCGQRCDSEAAPAGGSPAIDEVIA